jgi:F-type H+-transporting ATPase subunit c
MKTLKLLGVILAVACLLATPALAFAGTQVKNKVKPTDTDEVQSAVPDAPIFSGAGVGAGIGAALCIMGAGYGFGRIGSAALESMSRQPEVAGKVQTGMIIIAALLEGATFFALLICIQLAGKANF